MPRYEKRCAGYTLRIKDRDHRPPHCHAYGPDFRDREIGLHDLELLRGRDRTVRSAALRDCLERHRKAMLKAWDEVITD